MIPRTLLFLSLLFLAGCSRPTPTLTVNDFGIYDAKVVTKGDWKMGRPVVIVSVDNLTHKETTTKIPAQKGVYWGLRAQTTNPYSDRSVHLTCSISHPPVTRPDGQTSTEDANAPVDLLPGKAGHLDSIWFFLDDSPSELVPGEWTVHVEIDGEPVLTKVFEVYKP